MIPNVPTSDSGRATAGMNVARRVRRNTKITPTTSTIDSTRVRCTSVTEARMVSVRSVTMLSWMPAGITFCRAGSAAFTRSTVSTMFAPGWRWMSMTTAGAFLYQAATRLFSTPPTTEPIADSRTGALLRQAITRSR